VSAGTAAPAVRLGEYKETAPGEFRVPDEDFYVAELEGWDAPIRSTFIDKATGEYPWRINLKFAIVADLQGDVEFAGETTSGFYDLDLNPNAKGSILHVLRALDPTEEPEPGAALEPYQGKRCIVEVVHKKKPSRTDPSVTFTFANIGGIKPMKKQKKSTAAEPEAPKRNPLLDEDE
jgi:hypothetical protein